MLIRFFLHALCPIEFLMSSHSASRQPNRLSQETSPYLLQHQFNPVDWYPWGEAAFTAAREQDKPVFLSVGYSACHWCHVMERESFENEAIAAILNDRYISIKVDREERPDVDQIYMTAVQLITRRGGWPMSVFMTPDGQPFYGGTYWPPTQRMGMPGFRDILLKLHDYWVNRRDEVLSSAGELVTAIRSFSTPDAFAGELSLSTLRLAEKALLRSVDRKEGGFGGAPKFPHPMDLRVLLRCWQRFGTEDAISAAQLTLDKMAGGGIYDQLGGGFHRYSTDAHWLVPHFEKMLYDNALLVPAYLEGWQATGNEQYLTVVRETLDYVLREMFQPGGGFYSTQDADSEGEEGKFFVWTEAEVDELLPAADSQLFKAAYDVSRDGNWEGHTILNRPNPLPEVARSCGISLNEFTDTLDRSRETLLESRSHRVAPGRDDKILVSWNGMMLAACSRAGAVLKEPRYIAAAEKSALFIAATLRDPAGRLLHCYKDGQARLMAYLDDYACLIDGLVELYQATGSGEWIDLAVEFADQMLAHFADPQGGFFYTADDHEELIARSKDAQDNATPSGNGMAATALLKLAALTGRNNYREAAAGTLQAVGEVLEKSPLAAGQSLIALDFLLGPVTECVLIDGLDQTADELQQTFHQQFLPRTVVARSHVRKSAHVAELFANRPAQRHALAFVCSQETCQSPTSEPQRLQEVLRSN